jgi:hypothetical protein
MRIYMDVSCLNRPFVLLTCDNRLLRRCKALAARVGVRVDNPKSWLEEQCDATDAG